MKHIWSVLCRHASVEAEVNVVSLLDVMEEITIEFPPSGPPPATGAEHLAIPMELVSLWRKENEREKGGRLRIILKTPRDPQPRTRPEADLVFKPDAPNARLTAKIQQILWRGPGEYTYVVQLRTKAGAWKTIAELPFILRSKDSAASKAPPEKAKSARGRRKQQSKS